MTEVAQAGRRTLLLISDSPEIHFLVDEQLRDPHLDIHHAHSGGDGLRQLQVRAPDLVLTDFRLPDIDTFEMMRQLRLPAREAPLCLILLTGPEDDPFQTLSFEPGVVDFLRKPFKVTELRARIRNVLQTQALRSRLKHQATHDYLTGLLNRNGFVPRLELAIAKSRAQPDTHFAVLFLDFDNFKALNDAYGHDVGDNLLRQMGERLDAALSRRISTEGAGPEHTIARFGGDEFVVLVEALAAPQHAEDITVRLLQALGHDYWIDGMRVTSSTSTGIVHGARNDASAANLLRDADAAMHEAKSTRKGGYAVFDSSLRRRIDTRARTERALHLAIESQQLSLLYQPIISLQSEKIVGLESLLRWQHPELGAVSPADFIPVAVDSGLIGPIGDWVLETACGEFRRLQRRMGTGAPEFIAVNVSRKQLTDSRLPAKICAALVASGVEPRCLHLEVTESELVTNLSAARDTLREIKRLGVALSVDDFGTGYSSLASLYDFPIDFFKLDRSFVAADLTSERGRALMAVTHAVLQLARNIGVRVIAEGVETAQQLAVLQSLRCDMAQGYLFGRPMPAEQILAWSRAPLGTLA